MRDSHKLIAVAFICILLCTMFISIGLTSDNYQYFLSRRIPKVLAMVAAGIAIGQSALVFQTITHNRILTPSIMGFDSLYMFTQVLVVVIFGGMSSIALNAYINFSLSVLVMMGFSLLLFTFYFKGKSHNLMVLLLLGVILGQLFSSISSFFTMLMDPNDFASVQANMFASFNNIKVELVYYCLPLLSVISITLYRLNRVLDVFWLDKDNATSLGVDVKRVTMQVLVLSAALIAISTALIGPIMFFGLLVTNLARELFSSYQHKILICGVSLLSIALLLGGQWIVENLFDFSTTISVVINFVGGIYFLTMLLRNKIV
ncbi:iron chelate uptake ABC transporter permease subunit VctG [Vibrio sp. TRT 1302]|uniref:iron chelate uptake ABC transporter permease subunit VctG n=1 Tax=Vibrio sp. TRT 1302 TaxID=3418504 RepID=UPI003CEA3DC3